MKIYTKNGDKGMTTLVSGSPISKADLRLKAYGELDELNSFLGFALVEAEDFANQQIELLQKIQEELFSAGSLLATESEKREQLKLPPLSEDLIPEIEKAIDELDSDLPALKNFVLPGGSELAARFNLCRVVCRRLETNIVTLKDQFPEEVPEEVLKLINRLSDYFFIAARWANFKSGNDEVLWKGRGS